MYADIAKRINIDGVCPAIIYPTQWGFPVLSHPSVCRKSVISLNRDLTYIQQHPSVMTETNNFGVYSLTIPALLTAHFFFFWQI